MYQASQVETYNTTGQMISSELYIQASTREAVNVLVVRSFDEFPTSLKRQL